MLFIDSLQLDVLAVVTAILVVFIAWQKWILGYWKRKGVSGPEPTLILGNLSEFVLGKKTLGFIIKDIYDEYKAKGHHYVGCFLVSRAAYFPIDLALVKSVFQDDFPNFHSHGIYTNERADPLSINVFGLDGQRWKEVRSKLTPTLTNAKIKAIHPILLECSDSLKNTLDDYADEKPVDIKDVMSRFLIDVIASASFGIDISSLKNPEEFRRNSIKVFAPSLGNLWRFNGPLFVPHELLRLINFKSQASDVVDFFCNLVTSTVKYREENKIERPDFLNMMIQMKNSKNQNERMSLNEIIGQSFVFFSAGYETSSSTISYAAYELAVNRDVQEKVREEINNVLEKYDGKVTYDAVAEMDYLEMVIKETLRKYPPLTFLFRKCTKKYTIPGENVVIDEGTVVISSTLGVHYDPEYYPDPDKFDPERFSKENIQSRPAFTWLPFGEGPRMCLGYRYGMYQAKMGILYLLRNYRVNLNEKTVQPFVFDPSSFVHSCVGGIWLDLKKLPI